MEIEIVTPEKLEPFLYPARYKGAHGGRGSGKSHFFAEMMIEQHLLDQNHSSVCIREVQKSLDQSVKKLLENKIQAMNAGAYFDVQDAKIKSLRGSGLIIFQGMQNHTAETIKSLEGYKTAWFEEAQTASQKSLDLLRPTIRAPGSELWFTWNPDQPTDPIDALLRGDRPPPDAVVIEVNYQDNPHFPDELRAEMEYDRGRDFEKYEHIWLGHYRQSSEARVFRNWTVEDFDQDPDAILRQGADWGFAVDPTVLVQCYIQGRKLYITHEAYKVGCEIVDTPALFMEVPDAERWPIVADGARPETISHMKSHGFPKISPAVKGAGSVEDGIEWLKSFDIIVHPRCKHVIAELQAYSYKVDPLTNKVLPILADKNNHCLVAGTLVSTARGEIPIEDVLIGDRVITPVGERLVTFSGCTGYQRELVRVVLDGGEIECTPDHKIWTNNRGFVRADALRYDDEVSIIGDESCAWKKWYSRERHTGDTQTRKDGLMQGILVGLSLVALSVCMWLYGSQ